MRSFPFVPILLSLGLSVAAATAASAATVTADFEGITSTYDLTNTIVSQGYAFSAADGSNTGVVANGSVCSPVCADDGTATLIFGVNRPAGINPPSINPLTITGASDFRLGGFDLGELQPAGSGFNATYLVVTGFLSGGGTMSEIVKLDGINDGPGGVADFQTVTFDSAFAGSTFSRVEIAGQKNADLPGGFMLDNVTLSTGGGVPEPAGWALMILGFGLAGAGLRERRTRLV